ncbi:uncharacterized protein MONBRDRAFT_29809 [Monosiga brevicollis MX1]|uniref:Fe2OG dioxygenase domain-containing protein n=1 Tax=Monosiga brevicollis TaxID=81824 RepID=A9VC67_MONBE|nr:uncharacterized protein MONBRDRAFT_29809 [Monosiga brevicollis MX1]EDQ84846.1 predicted protein [Monosiga brevicollis MX1]|eukprot:XP_001750347.1 hypothetical protein [Monosiga brevicollis MX1]
MCLPSALKPLSLFFSLLQVNNGYVIIDDFWPAEYAQAMRDAILALHKVDGLAPNRVSLATSAGPLVLTKPHVFEADMHDKTAQALCPLFADFLDNADAFQTALAQRLPALKLVPAGRQSRTVKLQFNEGGGAFPWHYDNPSRPNARRLTILTYLNPDWAPGDGGELELLPFLGEPTRIEPRMNRVLLFLADELLHKVIPAVQRRMVFTLWLDGEATNTDDVVHLKVKHLNPDAIPLLTGSPLQRSVSRAVYSDLYEESLRACFGADSADLRKALALHRAHVKALLQNQALADFVAELKSRRPF